MKHSQSLFDDEMSPTLSSRKRDRVSCEPCRTRKIRCPGERPVCSRCVSTRRDCVYSMRMPMGRPKSRRATLGRGRFQGEPQTAHSAPSSQNDASTDVAERAEQTENTGSQQNEAIGFLRPVQEIPTSTSSAPYLVDFENYQRVQTTLRPEPLTAFPAATINFQGESNCTCLPVIYLLLDQLRMKTQLLAPDDLTLLRESLDTAHRILNCVYCPQRYFSVIQNAVLLGLLCICLAECYARIVEWVNVEEKRAARASEQKQLSILGTKVLTGTGSAHVPFPVEVTPSEWGNLMRSAVKFEVFGSDTDNARCFKFLIERLEERQRCWHETPPAADCPPGYRSSCRSPDRIPTCLMLIGDARVLVDSLRLESTNS